MGCFTVDPNMLYDLSYLECGTTTAIDFAQFMLLWIALGLILQFAICYKVTPPDEGDSE